MDSSSYQRKLATCTYSRTLFAFLSLAQLQPRPIVRSRAYRSLLRSCQHIAIALLLVHTLASCHFQHQTRLLPDLNSKAIDRNIENSKQCSNSRSAARAKTFSEIEFESDA